MADIFFDTTCSHSFIHIHTLSYACPAMDYDKNNFVYGLSLRWNSSLSSLLNFKFLATIKLSQFNMNADSKDGMIMLDLLVQWK